MTNKVIIFSGGLDSTVLLYEVASQLKEGEILYCLNFFYGQRHSIECKAAENVIDYLTSKIQNKVVLHSISLKHVFDYLQKSALLNGEYEIPKARDVLGDPQPLSYVPNRNMIMLSTAVGFAESTESNEVYYGAQQADTLSGYWDASAEFLESINKVICLNRKHRGAELNVPFELTWTCYNPIDVPGIKTISCGECVACANRLQGFINAKMKDPMEYAISIDYKKYGIL